MRSTRERLIYTISEEIDVYINMLQERMIENQEVRNFVCHTVIPRFNILREIAHECKEDESVTSLPDC